MRQYEVFQIELKGDKPSKDWVHVDLEAEFSVEGLTTRVKGFYAGNGLYIVRYLPMKLGRCHFRIQTSPDLKLEAVNIAQTALGVLEGEEMVEPGGKGCHGPVRAEGTHFVYEDQTAYFPFGTTVYALMHQPEELIDRTMKSLENAPFNKIRMCIFPKHFDFNRNEPQDFAFEKNKEGKWDTQKPCFTFWNRLDRRIEQLGKLGVEADLILLHPYDRWGFMHLSREEYETYFEYLIRRVSAYPNVWWSLANEYDQMDGLEQADWEDFARYISQNDPYHHLLSNHNFVHPWDFANLYTTHCCLQESNAAAIPALLRTYQKPVIFDEMGYEGNIPYNWGNLSAFELVNRFWKVCTMGGYGTHGETYMEKMEEDQVLWWSKGGILKGKSVPRIAFLRGILEEMPGIPKLYQPKGGLCFENQEQLKELVEKGTPGISDNLVFKCMCRLDDREFTHMMEFMTQPVIHCSDEVFLTYLGDACTIYTVMDLPGTQEYTIEIIDVWEMTRTVVQEHAKGKTPVQLPGKAGIAVMARR